MRCTCLFVSFALAVTVVADGISVLKALTTVDSRIKTLTSQFINFPGDLESAVPIATEALQHNQDIADAAEVVQESQPLSFDETLGIADIVLTIIDDMTACMDALIADKPKFDKLDGVNPLIVDILYKLRGSANQLGSALIEKEPDDFKEVAKELVGEVNAQFERSLKAYSGSSGGNTPCSHATS